MKELEPNKEAETETPVEEAQPSFHFLATVEVFYRVAKTIIASRKYNVVHRYFQPDLDQLALQLIVESAMNQFIVDETVPKTADATANVITSINMLGHMTEMQFQQNFLARQEIKKAQLKGLA